MNEQGIAPIPEDLRDEYTWPYAGPLVKSLIERIGRAEQRVQEAKQLFAEKDFRIGELETALRAIGAEEIECVIECVGPYIRQVLGAGNV